MTPILLALADPLGVQDSILRQIQSVPTHSAIRSSKRTETVSPASLPIAAVASGSNDKIRATLLGMEPKSGLPRVMGMDRDTNEVGELYARTCAPLIGLLASIGGSRSDAEEVAQDAFVKLLGRWESVREYDDPEAWLRTVAVRMLISRHRRSQVASLGLKRLAGNRVRTAGTQPGKHRDRASP